MNKKGKVNITYLSLEVMNPSLDRVVVTGDKSDLNSKDDLLDLFSFKANHKKE